MGSERGGPITGFLIGIGAIVVFFGLLAVACGACTSNKDSNHSLGRVELIRHDRCSRDDCGDRYGDGGSGGGQGASGGDYGGGKGGDTDQRGDHNCRNFCFYGIPNPAPGGQQPKSLTDPRKLPAVIAQIAKSGLDMGQLFATTTIKFVEDLFVALA